MAKLIAPTVGMVRCGYATGLDVASVVGSWTWALMVRRPALSVLNNVYRFIKCANESVYELWKSVRLELLTLRSLAPLLVHDMHAPMLDRLVATDASSYGCGIIVNSINI